MSPRQLPYIDALRGLAVLGVVAVHASIAVQPSHPALAWLASEGARGVQLFYVASALTLGLSWAQRSAAEHAPTRNFLLRRFFRIAPMFYLAIAYYTLTAGLGPQYWAPHGIEPWFIAATALFLHGWHPETVTSVVPGGWSIAVEMTFYLLLPCLLPRLRHWRDAGWLIVASLLLYAANRWAVPRMLDYPPDLAYLVDNFAYLNFFGQFPVFAIGLFLYLVVRDGVDAMRVRSYAPPALAALAVALVLGIRGVPQHLLAALFFAVLAWALSARPVGVLVNPLTIALGRWSFSLYLVHFAVLRVFRDLGWSAAFAPGDAGSAAHFAAVLAVSAAVAAATYRCVERPGIALGARWIARLEARAAR
jgi:peptidoglycan/LPS O-acetylase OafA/YrhL